MILVVLIALLVPYKISYTSTVVAEDAKEIAPEAPKPHVWGANLEEDRRLINELITRYAAQYGASEATMQRIITCENRGRIHNLQSGHRYKRDYPEWGVVAGEQEKSYGIVQIHLPSWPSITYQQAIDPDFSIRFLAEKLAQGKGSLWSCY